MSESTEESQPWWRSWLAPAAVIGLLGLALTAYGVFIKDSGPPTGETISLDVPSKAEPGGTIAVTVDDGFEAGEQVRVDIDGRAATQVKAEADGGILALLPVATDAPSRTYFIRATGLSSGRTGSAGVPVTRPP